jgi:L-threonylcarbamoyladenylate synthase
MPTLDGRQVSAVESAAQRLQTGELVAFPTETVYGLGARADDDAAVARIYAAKGRPAAHPLIVHLADAARAEHFAASIGASAQTLMERFWPGPLTLIVPRRPGRGDAAAARLSSIGLRVPSHPVALALLQQCARLGLAGLAAPSANRFGRVSPTTAAHVVQEFGAGLWVLDGGACEVGIESTIVDCTREQPALLRPGRLGRAELEAVLGRRLAEADAQSPRAPGSLASHYAPAATVRLMNTRALEAAVSMLHGAAPAGLAVYSRTGLACPPGVAHRRMPGDAVSAAHELFAALRDFDAAGVRLVWVEHPPDTPDWDGVRDRLQRAAA